MGHNAPLVFTVLTFVSFYLGRLGLELFKSRVVSVVEMSSRYRKSCNWRRKEIIEFEKVVQIFDAVRPPLGVVIRGRPIIKTKAH